MGDHVLFCHNKRQTVQQGILSREKIIIDFSLRRDIINITEFSCSCVVDLSSIITHPVNSSDCHRFAFNPVAILHPLRSTLFSYIIIMFRLIVNNGTGIIRRPLVITAANPRLCSRSGAVMTASSAPPPPLPPLKGLGGGSFRRNYTTTRAMFSTGSNITVRMVVLIAASLW
jgi:hypothetical protein